MLLLLLLSRHVVHAPPPCICACEACFGHLLPVRAEHQVGTLLLLLLFSILSHMHGRRKCWFSLEGLSVQCMLLMLV